MSVGMSPTSLRDPSSRPKSTLERRPRYRADERVFGGLVKQFNTVVNAVKPTGKFDSRFDKIALTVKTPALWPWRASEAPTHRLFQKCRLIQNLHARAGGMVSA